MALGIRSATARSVGIRDQRARRGVGILPVGGGSYLPTVGLVARYDFARVNLLKFSEQLGDSSWVKTRASVTADAVVAPDGTSTADKLVEDTTATSTHFFQQPGGATLLGAGSVATLSIYAKAAGRTQIQVQEHTTIAASAIFDLASGSVASTKAGTAAIQSVGNGWYRCSVSGTLTTSMAFQVLLVNVTGSYTGDGTSGVYLWGAQLNTGSVALPYERTTDLQTLINRVPNYNLLAYSEQFNQSFYTKYRGSITSNAATAPDGTLTADRFVEDTTALATHQISDQSRPNNYAANTTYTYSIYAKAAERTRFRLDMYDGSAYFARATFDLSNGSVVETLNGTSSIHDGGNGWYRCVITGTAGPAPTGQLAEYLLVQSGTVTNYTGDGVSGLYLWGAMLNVGSSALAYERTLASGATYNVNSGLSGYHGQLGSTSGADSNDPQWQSNALLFDGVDDQVTLPLLAGASTWGGLTVLSVVNSSVSATQEIIREGGVADGYFLRFNGDGVSVDLSVGNAGGQRDVYSNPAPRSGDQFLAMTWALAGNLRGYTGATKVRDVASNLTSSGPTATTPMLGRIAGTEPFNGTMRYLAVYNRALSDREIAQAYKYLKGVMASRGVSI